MLDAKRRLKASNMVAENFDILDKASSLVVNGYHRIPPHPATWPLSSPSEAGAAGLPTISRGFSRWSVESREVHNLYEMVAHEVAGNFPAHPKTFRTMSSSFFRGSTVTDKPDLSNPLKPNYQRTSLTDSSLAQKTVGVNRWLKKYSRQQPKSKK